MTQKIVLVEAFNENVFDFQNSRTQFDLGGILNMATFAKANPNRVSCKMEITTDRFSLEMPHADFLKALSQDNILPGLKAAFYAAEQIDQGQTNAGPQPVAGTNLWQVSIVSP